MGKSVIESLQRDCISQLVSDEWYTCDFVAKVINCENFSHDDIIRALEVVAEVETTKNHKQVKVVRYKEIGSRRLLTEEQKIAKRNAGEVIIPRLQYVKCVRTLIESSTLRGFTLDDLIQLYLGSPIEDFCIKGKDRFNDCIRAAIYNQTTLDMYDIDRNKRSNAIKHYLILDQKLRVASHEETEIIKAVMEDNKKTYENSLTFYEYEKAKKQINLAGIKFVDIGFEIEYSDDFPYKEIYTPELIKSSIFRKWDSFVSREVENKGCGAPYGDWRKKFIEPNLVGDKKGA